MQVGLHTRHVIFRDGPDLFHGIESSTVGEALAEPSS